MPIVVIHQGETGDRTMQAFQLVGRGLLMAALAGLSGCSEQPGNVQPGNAQRGNLQPLAPAAVGSSPAIEGKWLTPTGGSIEFRPGGQAIMSGPNGSRELQFSVIGGKRIELRLPDGNTALSWEIVSVQDQTLTIIDPDGKNVELRKAG